MLPRPDPLQGRRRPIARGDTAPGAPPGLHGARVLLLHGIARGSASLRRLEWALRAEGAATLNLDYPSRRLPVEALAEVVRRSASGFLDAEGGPVHVVTHSMGGLVARAAIARRRPRDLGRVVMLGPPNQGSEIADLLAPTRAYRWFYGPAGLQLTTRQDAALRAGLGRVDYPLGIIAGSRSLDPLASLVLPRPHDGRVSVARTGVEGMADHLTVRAAHPLMVRDPEVIRQVLHFLRHGRFARVPPPRHQA